MRRTILRLVIVGLVGAVVAVVGAGPAAAAPVPAAAAGVGGDAESDTLFVRYLVKGPCTVYPNLPKNGVVGNAANAWTVVPDGARSVIWRYNVDADWAVISDPVRAGRHVAPWWGFTHRDCLAASVTQAHYPANLPVPGRVLEGRSNLPAGWRSVDLDVAPAPVTGRHRLDSVATLRDPANFVIGNVLPGWTVEVTGRTRTGGHWVEVHAPDAGRWGYVEQSDLR